MDALNQKSKRRFMAGLIIVLVFSLFCGFLNIGTLFWLGVPFLPILFGLVLVWASKEPISAKLVASGTTLPSLVTGFALFYFSLPRAEPEMFLIPSTFRGTFTVKLGNCGGPIPYEDGRRVYRIPENGVLFHNGKRTEGVLDRRFFLVDGNEQPAVIPEFTYGTYAHEADSWRWKLSSMELSDETVGVFWAYRNYLAFRVYSYRQIESETKSDRELENAALQNVIDSEMKRLNCQP